jgi:hypothetical protein
MNTPYDETFEEFERRTGLDAFFSDYSNQVRGKLLSKNLEKPKDVYDVIYPQVRKENVSKNIITSNDLEAESQIIRDNLLSKFVSNQVSLEESGELQRRRLESKNKLIESSKNIEDFGEESRKKAVQKNLKLTKTLETISRVYRSENISKNTTLNNNNDTALNNNFSTEIREGLLAKNLSKDNNTYSSNLDLDSLEARNKNLKYNKDSLNDLSSDSKNTRELNESKNISNNSDLISDSEIFRDGNISKNKESETDLQLDSNNFRNNNEYKNENKNSDLDSDSSIYRSNSIGKNSKNTSNLLSDSLVYKNSNESKNDNKINSNLDVNSEEYRNNSLNKNVSSNNDLENSSVEIRENNFSKNNNLNSNLELNSVPYRNDSESKNLNKNFDLKSFSDGFQGNLTSKNESKKSDLENYSKDFRNERLQKNTSNSSNLESDSIEFRQQDLSNNNPKISNLEFKSGVYRNDDLSYNKPKVSNLEQDSEVFRDDDLSNNNPSISNLESDSTSIRQDDLSKNTPIQTDLINDSVVYRNDDLSTNVTINSDLQNDSTQIRDNNLASNVSSNSDLDGDSFQYLVNNINSNTSNNADLEVDSDGFRLNNLQNNISQSKDLSDDSIGFRNDNLSYNIEKDINLSEISKAEREEQKSANISSDSDIEVLSKVFRNEQLSKNPSRFNLGANIITAGSSDYIGVSKLEVSGSIFRKANEALNNNGNSLKSIFDDEESKTFFDEVSSNQVNSGGRDYLLQKNSLESLKSIEGISNIYGVYGTSLVDDSSKADDGLSFYSSPKSEGFITNLISLHNIQQNTFQNRPGYNYQSGNQNAIEQLSSFGSSGFQELLSKSGIQKRLQVRTNTTPADVITQNGGKYLSNAPEKILKPLSQSDSEELGTGVSMASQTDTTDTIAFDFDGESSRRRGVRHVINTIASDDRIAFAQNFNVQGNEGSSSVFIVGKKSDGQYKKNFNRYSIKNPYAPEGAETLRFVLTNYSIPAIEGSAMSFPAYIKSFQHGDSASWNSTTFLGRPEPIYTYSNSSRDGSISFFILTDFATEVDIGYDFNPQNGVVTKVTENFDNNNFSKLISTNTAQADELRAGARSLEASIVNVDEAASEEEKKRFKAETDAKIAKANELKAQANILDDEASLIAQRKVSYSEKTAQGENIYKFFEGFDTKVTEDNYIESKAENTVKKLAEMKRKNMFQPSYFSGSKVDFLKRMEFIAKMTRPARNRLSERTNSGFSFSRPPVCHLTLGDWLDHDIVVNSVSYNYSDSPWTFDGGRVQPMWCEVTLNFNIIGSYGGRLDEDPPLSTDEGGFFSRRTSV